MPRQRQPDAKRANGEGSVYPVRRAGRTRWLAALTWPDGKRHTRTADTEKAGEKKLRELITERNAGLVPIRRLTVKEALAQYLQAIQPSVSLGTWQAYERQFRLHVLSDLGRVRLAELTPLAVQTMLNRVAADRPHLANQVRETLAIALNWAVAQGWLNANPVRGTRRALYEPPASPVATPVVARAILTAVRGHRWEALWTTQLGTALRIGEVLGLRWSDLDLEADPPLVQVRQQVRRATTGVEVAPVLKSRRARREVPLPPIAVEALVAHQARLALTWGVQGVLVQDESAGGAGAAALPELVFVNYMGGPINPVSVQREFKRVLRRAGLDERLTPHDLRHCAATTWAERGSPLTVVRDLLGHENIAMTSRYAHTTVGQRRAAAAGLEAVLREEE